ncbi:hypothetical protein [Pseudomonas sp. TMP25]|uniref:hypothetical protein n=1 Tax=Pseudomonas sp. TMP25 TaxID=3136561 RepID=UPI0031017C96
MNAHRQSGQAMVFGLFFIGIALIGLILMYNHGIMTRDRVQVENAADAAAYSQAKLFARHQNLIAYTNRAIVANEMSVGQVVALMSWSKRYANIPRWVNSFPAYQIPIVPAPKPTVGDVLSTITLPYQILGTLTGAVAKPLLSIYPDVISSFNLVMGFFQKIFAVATLEAQFTTPISIVNRHEMPDTSDDLKVVTLSHLLLVQNFILTYFASDLNLSSLTSQAKSASTAAGGSAASSDDFVADFLGSLAPSTMLVNTSPEKHSDSNGQNAENSAARTAGRQYAAIMNSNRNDWLDARNFNATAKLGIPEISITLYPLKLTFSFNLEVGVFNNGGTAYVYNPQSTAATGKGIPRYGWSSVDFSSMGFKIAVPLKLELCLPQPIGCLTILNTTIGFGLGLPLGGGTHQIVAKAGDQFLIGPQWGSPTQNSPPGSSSPYGEAMQSVHATTWAWGNTLAAFGANQAEDVSTGYGGAPSFFSLGRDYQARGTSNEFTVAVAKPLSSLRTSDNPESLGLDTGKFALDTQGVTDNALSSLWGGPDHMMTIASAESYFAPPPGRVESPNQFSPFWDARLREPSRVVQMIAAGQIDLMAVLGIQPGASTSAIVGAVLDLGLKKLIEPGKDRVLEKLPSVISGPVKPVLDKFVDTVTGTASGAVSELVK